jgi:3-oxoacyl-[acyl-carrier protein] reductase
MKVAVVTGGSSGIGAATAQEFSRRDWRVAIVFSRDSGKAEQAASGLKEAILVKGDVAQDADCRRVAREVFGKWGRIDALVNNAGITKHVKHTDLEGLSADDMLSIFRVNLVGPFQMVRACAGALKQARGAVVNVSSVASLLGTGSSIAYAASKAALNTMTLSLARALGPEVRVNAVCPGFVMTPWHLSAHGAQGAEEQQRRFAEKAPLKAAPRAEDVAAAILWFAEGARSTTGEIFYVDGGMHVASPR